MWVSSLRLTDFRSYEQADIALTTGVTTLVGANGQGKTNIVEALAYSSVLGSHRVASDAPLVRAGAERAIIGVTIERPDRSVLVELEINPGKANRARINRAAATRARDVLGLLTTVVFAPEDLALVKGDPSDRRRFMDELMIQLSPRMQGVKSDYERILKQRNALLKSAQSARRNNADEVVRTLEVWDEQLATTGGQLVATRHLLLDQLTEPLTQAYRVIAGGDNAVSSPHFRLDYQASARHQPTNPADPLDWKQAILQTIEDRRRDELDRGITLVGPHRDELALTLGELPAKGYASHGESWSMALALRLASFDLLSSTGDEPVLILDDVFAELDTSRRRTLTERVVGCRQVLVTAAVDEDIPESMQGRRFDVTKGTVRARESSHE